MPQMTMCNLLLSLLLNSKGSLHKAEVALYTVPRCLHKIHKINKTLRFLIPFHVSLSIPSAGLLPSTVCKYWCRRSVGLTGSQNQHIWKGHWGVRDAETQGRGCLPGAAVQGNDFIWVDEVRIFEEEKGLGSWPHEKRERRGWSRPRTGRYV